MCTCSNARSPRDNWTLSFHCTARSALICKLFQDSQCELPEGLDCRHKHSFIWTVSAFDCWSIRDHINSRKLLTDDATFEPCVYSPNLQLRVQVSSHHLWLPTQHELWDARALSRSCRPKAKLDHVTQQTSLLCHWWVPSDRSAGSRDLHTFGSCPIKRCRHCLVRVTTGDEGAGIQPGYACSLSTDAPQRPAACIGLHS